MRSLIRLENFFLLTRWYRAQNFYFEPSLSLALILIFFPSRTRAKLGFLIVLQAEPSLKSLAQKAQCSSRLKQLGTLSTRYQLSILYSVESRVMRDDCSGWYSGLTRSLLSLHWLQPVFRYRVVDIQQSIIIWNVWSAKLFSFFFLSSYLHWYRVVDIQQSIII